MDRAAHLVAEDLVDELVLVDPGQAVEALGHDLGAEVVAAAGQVLDLAVGAREGPSSMRVLSSSAVGIASDSDAYGYYTRIEVDGHPDRHRHREGQGVPRAEDAAGSGAGLRVGVRGGGCSGFQYSLALDEQRDGDQVFEHDGITVLVDEQSLRYVDGSIVDYTESLMGAGFEVQNPNVVASCGCGSSFRVKDDEDAAACASTLTRNRRKFSPARSFRWAMRNARRSSSLLLALALPACGEAPQAARGRPEAEGGAVEHLATLPGPGGVSANFKRYAERQDLHVPAAHSAASTSTT